MSWEVRYTRTFLKELSRLPSTARKRVEEIAFGKQIKDDPFLLGKTQKLAGYKSFYKIRRAATELVYKLIPKLISLNLCESCIAVRFTENSPK